MADYPKRPSHFAHKFTRLLIKTCVCQDLGTGAFALLTTIAHTEDAAHYRRPVTWFNEQLMAVLGMSRDQLVRVRKKCIDAEWLNYESGAKGRAGRYWVSIPEHALNIDDLPTDEGGKMLSEFQTESADIPSEDQTESRQNGKMPSENQTANPLEPRRQTSRNPDGKPASFNPTPDPNTTPPNPPSEGGESWEKDLAEARRIVKAIHPADRDGWCRLTGSAPDRVRAIVAEMGGWAPVRDTPDKDFAREFVRRWKAKHSTRRRKKRA